MSAVELGTLAQLWLDMLRTAREAAKQAKADEDEAKRHLLELLGDSDKGTVAGTPVVSRNVSVRSSVDSAQLREEYPDVYAMVLRETQVVSVRLIEPK